MKKIDGFNEVDQSVIRVFVTQAADDHLSLYDVTGNGLLIWKAYAEYRQFGMPVPEAILAKLDEYGERLQTAKDANAVAKALDLQTGKGGPQRETVLQGQERSRDIVRDYHIARIMNSRRSPENRKTMKDLAAEVGRRHGITGQHVQTRYAQWRKATSANSSAESADPIADLLASFARKI